MEPRGLLRRLWRFAGGYTDLAIVADVHPAHHITHAWRYFSRSSLRATYKREDQRPHDRAAEAVGGVGIAAVLQLRCPSAAWSYEKPGPVPPEVKRPQLLARLADQVPSDVRRPIR